MDGLSVLDLGCGDGQLCRELVELGAASVLGVDPSARLLDLAAERTTDPRAHYQRDSIEDLVLPADNVDLVVSSLALHYVADLAPVLHQISAWRRPGGVLVASTEVTPSGAHVGTGCPVDRLPR